MSFRKLFIASCLATLFLWDAAWAQRTSNPQSSGQPGSSPGAVQNPPAAQSPVAPGDTTTTEEPSPASSSTPMNKGKEGKEQHWSGTLVDVPCMAKLLGNKRQGAAPGGAADPAGSQGSAPRFMGSGFAGQAGQQPGGAPTPGAPTQGQAPAAGPVPGQTPDNPGMTPAQQAQMARAERVDDAAKQCAASSSTQNFGLAMSGGQVVQFDSDGNSKAQEALKEVQVQPGKKIKAKVTGTMQSNVTVKVASVEVKGKRTPGSAPATGQ